MESFNPENFLILIVDDISQNLKVVGAVFDQAGYGTTFALGGQQALDRLAVINPDLILLDWMMPEISGLELCKKLKANPCYEDIPIIFLTANHDTDALLEAFKYGAIDYVTKPFHAPELLARVKTHLQLKSAQDRLKKALADIKTLATTDPLTGVFNRRFFLEFAQKEISRVHRYDYSLSTLMLDVDHFKQINDTYGHNIGDEVLKFLTQVLLKIIRKADCLARLGGEEFAILLPQTPLEGAEELARRILQVLRKSELNLAGKIIRLTLSIGVSSYQVSEDTIEESLKRADRALFAAKNQGRDRFVIYPPDVPTLVES
ncbi:response regulator receiver modulated diguanylate cyclase [Rippkaea orientalis PCC 8801]|uniref:Response regulator receiver modulated diguanylate cyclase n=1 Tax=Rippkaea orientalis (strain PCC 8801 / RF-1) TaxID=41431 RepID=B7JYZ8_RIPO1|nr:diguanylate cyclase [Rippkaea orientalis]ACK66075.1 response regulator receiver modulated diguanylate cyclase [Rippkaea orientalis PCC 8801]